MLLLTPTSSRGPIPKLTPHLVAALRSLGCEVVERPWGRHAVHEAGPRRVIRVLTDVAAARAVLRQERFDVLAVNTSHGWATLARDIPFLCATRAQVGAVALQLHGSRVEWFAEWRHFLFNTLSRLRPRFPDMILVLSHGEARQFAVLLPGHATSVVVNPFVPRWKRADGDGLIGRGDAGLIQPLRLLFVGRVIAEKGVLDVVRALALLREKREATLDIAGEGPASQSVLRLAKELGVDDAVTAHGYADAKTLATLYGRASVFAFPTFWKEGFPTVLAEAMHTGLPIVTTRIRGAADYLEEGVNALFVPARDPRAVADAVLRVAEDDVLRASMSAANRAAARRFGADEAGRVYLHALHRTVAASQSTARW